MKTLGKIAVRWGILLLVASALTAGLTSSYALAIALAVLGGVLVTVRVVVGGGPKRPDGPVADSAAARSGFFYGSATVMIALTVGLLGLTNYIVAKRARTYDLTSKKIFSLAPQTVSTLKNLKEPVTAIGFLPPDHYAFGELDELFRRYAQESDQFHAEFKDPRKEPLLAAKYQLKEGQTTVILTRGQGASESHTSLSVISEQDLTNALIKLDEVGTQKLYALVGHGEWTMEALPPSGPEDEESIRSISELRSSLMQDGYAPAELNLAEHANEIPRDAAVVMIAGAKTRFTAAEAKAIDDYLAEGGRLLYFAEFQADPGLDAVLAKYGVKVDDGLLADDKVNPGDPFLVVSPIFADHEITRLLKSQKMNVKMFTARGLTVLREGTLDGVTTTPLVVTSPYAWEESSPGDRPAPDSGEKAGSIPMVVAATRPTKDAPHKRFDETRVVVMGDSQLLVDAAWKDEADRNLVLNSVAWASAQTSKITIRPPDRDISVIDIDQPMRAKIQFLSIIALPLVLIGLGLTITTLRRDR